jgi:hypothetical protein
MTLNQLDLEMKMAVHGRNPEKVDTGKLNLRMNRWAKKTYGVVLNESYSIAQERECGYTASVHGLKR